MGTVRVCVFEEMLIQSTEGFVKERQSKLKATGFRAQGPQEPVYMQTSPTAAPTLSGPSQHAPPHPRRPGTHGQWGLIAGSAFKMTGPPGQ